MLEEKIKIGVELYPLVEAIDPLNVKCIISEFVRFDVQRLRNLIESPQLIRAEVDLNVKQLNSNCIRNKVARFVERALQKAEELPSIESLTINVSIWVYSYF